MDYPPTAAEPAPLSRAFLGALKILGLDKDPRCELLRHRASFAREQQYGHCPATWEGNDRKDPGVGYMQERLKPAGFVPVNSAPAGMRAPDAPVPLPRQIVSRFTEMLFSDSTAPALICPVDDAAQAFLLAVWKKAKGWEVYAQARDIAGGCGEVAIAHGLVNGLPFMEALDPANLWVAEWDDMVPWWRPKVVVEQIMVDKTEPDPETGKLTKNTYWQTRAWTDQEVILYKDRRVDDKDKVDQPFEIWKHLPHKYARCPVVWYQNTLCTNTPDGDPDCEGVWPLFDKNDRLWSQVHKAAFANADPSLVLKKEETSRGSRGGHIQKGSRGVIPVGPNGDAKYLEMTGSSVETAMKVVAVTEQQILQTVECVIVTPENASAYQSGEALQVLWRSMESRCSRKRVTAESAVLESASLWMTIGAAHAAGEIRLPPRKTDAGTWVPHTMPQEDTYVDLVWPPYHKPTPTQLKALADTMVAATGAKQFVSSKTAVDRFANYLGVDPQTEQELVEGEATEDLDREEAHFEAEMDAKAAPKVPGPGGPPSEA